MKSVAQARADWDTMTETEKEEWLRDFVNDFLSSHGGDGVTSVTFDDAVVESGHYDPATDSIMLNEADLGDFGEAVDTALHECIHNFQFDGGETYDEYESEIDATDLAAAWATEMGVNTMDFSSASDADAVWFEIGGDLEPPLEPIPQNCYEDQLDVLLGDTEVCESEATSPDQEPPSADDVDDGDAWDAYDNSGFDDWDEYSGELEDYFSDWDIGSSG